MRTDNDVREAEESSRRTSSDPPRDDVEEYADIVPADSKKPKREDPDHADLSKTPSGVLNFQDDPVSRHQSHVDPPYEAYSRFSDHRKHVIVAVISWCGLLSPISSTAVLSALPEVASEYRTSGDVISLSNALYLVFMALSPCFWGPLSQVYGRKWTCTITPSLFLACSVGTALGPNVAAFFVFRVLTAFAGTSFLVTGPAVIGDLYHPTARATAMGWFLSGTLIGPTIGPVLGGLIVTYSSWRAIFWLQTALAGVGVVGAVLLLPETLQHLESAGLAGLPIRKKLSVLWTMTNPARVVRLLRFPNLVLVALASGSLVWNMYGMLTPIRYVLNPRFALTSPAQSGLFYLAPRVRVTSRERSSAGGTPTTPLNTYCLDVVPGRSAEVIAGNFMVRYLVGAAGSAVVLPAVDKIGVGWFSTVSAAFLVCGAVGVWAVALWGTSWRRRVNEKMASSES
ncbi:MFS antiporter QDR3 [Colletotrichum trifolii]|uniref:MFS antiporter QDR3 n=1 Tax=Colletotrichum trifolii TaxID=5466 RepID=A0A4R8S0V2_COLTR|nr:MFS antiporter QDR3 [Colletotrichum trifolii]